MKPGRWTKLSRSGKRCAFYTLGCKVNQYDTEGLIELFRKRGYEIVDFNAEADVYCINTYAVTHVQTEIQASNEARKKGKHKRQVAVVGCYAQVAPEKVAAIRGVDVVIGTQGRDAL